MRWPLALIESEDVAAGLVVGPEWLFGAFHIRRKKGRPDRGVHGQEDTYLGSLNVALPDRKPGEKAEVLFG
tara:strand:+ start:691 stop:903 length:213 start_codon:yes stop_codon:yes gene_type:complete